MLYDWLCSNDEFCADNYNFQIKLKGKGRSVKWEVFLYGGMSINVDRDRAEVLPKGVLPASLFNDRCWSRRAENCGFLRSFSS